MAYKLIWSPAARDDLHDIVVFIARDNPNRAMSFGYELISETDRLQEFPELGMSTEDAALRQIVVRFGASGYIVRYAVLREGGNILITRIWHGREART